MKHYENDTNNNNPDKKNAMRSKMYGRLVNAMALPTLLLLLTLISTEPTYPVQATVGSNETATTPAPSGASVGPAGGGTNVTQSDCLPQNATTTNQSSAVNASGANTTTNNNTSTTFAPSGASIGTNDTSTSNATRGITTGNTTTNNTTTTTFAPSGASIC